MQRIHCDRCDQVIPGEAAWDLQVQTDETLIHMTFRQAADDLLYRELCTGCKLNELQRACMQARQGEKDEFFAQQLQNPRESSISENPRESSKIYAQEERWPALTDARKRWAAIAEERYEQIQKARESSKKTRPWVIGDEEYASTSDE